LGQEFIIKSQTLEDKVNQLLPSQGGFQAGVDLSASSMIVPVVNLTEAAEGSLLREDLQLAMSLTSSTAFNVSNATTTLVNTTGYFRVFATMSVQADTSANRKSNFEVTDGATTKELIAVEVGTTSAAGIIKVLLVDFIVFLQAGDSLVAVSTDTNSFLIGNTRQVADVNGNLINPL